MSMKVYNGYRLKGKPNLSDVHKFCYKLKDKIKPVAEKLFRINFINEMIEAHDKNQFGIYDDSMYFIKSSKDVYWGVESMISERMKKIKITQEKDYLYDYEFSFSIHPHKNKSVLILLYTERKELREAFEKLPEVEDYHYQDQTDKPKDISDKLWNKRRDEWHEVLDGGYGIPTECGFTYTPYIETRLGFLFINGEKRDMLIKRAISLDERAKNIANSLMAKEWDHTHLIHKSIKNPTPEEAQAIYNAGNESYRKYVDYRNTDEGKKDQKEKIESVKPQLKIFTTFKDFGGEMIFHNTIRMRFESETGGKPYWYDGKL